MNPITKILSALNGYIKELKIGLALAAIGLGASELLGWLDLPEKCWILGAFLLGICELEDHKPKKKE